MDTITRDQRLAKHLQARYNAEDSEYMLKREQQEKEDEFLARSISTESEELEHLSDIAMSMEARDNAITDDEFDAATRAIDSYRDSKCAEKIASLDLSPRKYSRIPNAGGPVKTKGRLFRKTFCDL